MTISQHPIRTTIFFGLSCGLSFIPANLALSYLLRDHIAINMTLWLYAAGYAMLLSRWSKKPIQSCRFPLFYLFVTTFLVDSTTAFYFLTLLVISWIRTGIYFRNSGKVKLVVELLLCVFGGITPAVFTPGTAFAWMLGIWMFFLIQSLYFVIFENMAIVSQHQYKTDPFERASRQAEAILSNL